MIKKKIIINPTVSRGFQDFKKNEEPEDIDFTDIYFIDDNGLIARKDKKEKTK